MKYTIAAFAAAILTLGFGVPVFGQNKTVDQNTADTPAEKADEVGEKRDMKRQRMMEKRWKKWDADKDGKITAEEFEAAKDPDAKWSDYDFDNDGEVTEDEWERASTSGTTGVRETEDKSQQDN